ncbi:OmpA family protein [Entomohabitans teleogrylli]|uniref:OmpA family protein n=1 Tax=Entomohabitans teleogrylli TaxID=1384589 RepID=UPI0009E9BAED|nr:OmpA family protein [Entomohabitans teleogrylli]
MKQMKLNLLLSACVVLVLSGCTRSLSSPDDQGKTAQPVFPEMRSAVRSEGSYPNVSALAKVKPGMSKAQIYELLGVPHFKEGALRVKEWDYIFHFPVAGGTDITCQYKVLYDSSLKVGSTYFLPENCLARLAPAQPVTAVTMHRELGAEALFGFASAQLSAEGEGHIGQLAADIRQSGMTVSRITIIGHTDRIGSAESNYRLSQARAESVKRVLAQNGISPAVMETRGMGASMPKVQCDGGKSPAVIACLAPNRRITVDVQ